MYACGEIFFQVPISISHGTEVGWQGCACSTSAGCPSGRNHPNSCFTQGFPSFELTTLLNLSPSNCHAMNTSTVSLWLRPIIEWKNLIVSPEIIQLELRELVLQVGSECPPACLNFSLSLLVSTAHQLAFCNHTFAKSNLNQTYFVSGHQPFC